jgi:hypothetical protein
LRSFAVDALTAAVSSLPEKSCHSLSGFTRLYKVFLKGVLPSSALARRDDRKI